MQTSRRRVHSLSAQMILSLIALVFLMALAAGLPATWLIRRQLERQASSQLGQATLVAGSLIGALRGELLNLATLTAQRPTLRLLLTSGDEAPLAPYLSTLQKGAGLDAIVICPGAALHRPIAAAGRDLPGEPCLTPIEAGAWFHVAAPGAQPRVWLLASHPLALEEGAPGVRVLAARALDDRYLADMRDRIGVDLTLLADGQPVASSLPARLGGGVEPLPARSGREAFRLDRHTYYRAITSLESGRLALEQALDVSAISAAQRGLNWTLAGSILSVAVIASLLGVLLARRTVEPLAHLARAAGNLDGEQLTRPLVVETRVREVAVLAHALEEARAGLERTLAELRSEKAWTDHLLESIVEGIVTLDGRGHITFFSEGAERITGWRRDQALGRSCDQVFRPAEPGEPFTRLIPTPGRRTKIPVELRDGRQAMLAVTGARLLPPEGREARVALVFRDVSEEEAVHRLLGHFLANVAHEFRTPLSALAASVELLLDQAPDLSPSEMGELLASLHLGVLGLQTLIDNLLESASIEAGRFRVQPRPSDLAHIVAESINTMQPLLDKRGQRLVVELPASMPVVEADPRRVVQVLINLLSNASRHGPDEAEIELRATVHVGSVGDPSLRSGPALAQRDGWVRVEVRDAGPGVPAGQRADLFRRFRRPTPEDDRAEPGAGLGLSVVKAVVEAHGGEVGIDDAPSGGAVFWFTLPVRAVDGRPQGRPLRPGGER